MLLVVGRIVRPHGIRGDLICEIRTDEPQLRFAAGSVLITDPAARGPLTVKTARPYQDRMLVSFDEVDDRNAAEAMRGTKLCVDSESLTPPEAEEEFRDHELIGLSVQDESGVELGRVVRVEHAPAHDLLVMRAEGQRDDVFIPFIAQMVPTVDVASGHVIVDLPPGLLDLSS